MNQNKATKSCTFLQWKHFFRPQPANYRTKQTEMKKNLFKGRSFHARKGKYRSRSDLFSIFNGNVCNTIPTIIITFHSYHIDGDALLLFLYSMHMFVNSCVRLCIRARDRDSIDFWCSFIQCSNFYNKIIH